MTWWLKRIYWTDERENASFWRDIDFITDPPGRRSKRLKGKAQPAPGQVRPPYAPHYEIGDHLLVCIASSPGCPSALVRRCPAILEVMAHPRWEPDVADQGGSRPKEGDRWGVATEVLCVHAVDPRDAPRTKRIGLTRLNQAPSSRLDDAYGQEAKRLLEQLEARFVDGVESSSGGPPTGRPTAITVEQDAIEGYDVTSKAEVRRAYRREQQLVASYMQYMRNHGDTVAPYTIPIPEGKTLIFSDVFNETRQQLIEAKADASRTNVRMAIGQLADYSRFITPLPRRAILLDARPTKDLSDLLNRQGVAIIWPEGPTFTDDAGGEFT